MTVYIKFFSLYLCHRGSIFAALTLLVVLTVILSCCICFCSARYVYWLEWWLKSVVFIILMLDDRKFWLYLAVLFILMDATFSSIPSFSKVISSGKADHIYPSMCFLGKGICYYFFLLLFFLVIALQNMLDTFYFKFPAQLQCCLSNKLMLC